VTIENMVFNYPTLAQPALLFVELPKIEKRLFLPMGTVEQLFRKGR
jgi:hypothetical protein